MPGYNCGEVQSKKGGCCTNCVFVSTYYVTIFLVVALETVCMLRFFFLVNADWAYSISCISLTLFFIFTDIAVFWSLTMAARSDPGYLIPEQRETSVS